MKKKCKYCKNEFNINDGRVFSNHVRWCEKNPNYDHNKFKQKLKKKEDERFGKKKKFKVKCKTCKKLLMIIEREKSFPKKEKYFCSRSCANSRILSKATKRKISSALTQNEARKCKNCGEKLPSQSHRVYCCDECKFQFREKERIKRADTVNKYKAACWFKFNIGKFQKEFDLSLIRKYGWYNSKTNLKGISRDHIVSIKYGFNNKISPRIISHPANCKLMSHTDNMRKQGRSSITTVELEKRIKKWNSKYSPYRGKFVRVSKTYD